MGDSLYSLRIVCVGNDSGCSDSEKVTLTKGETKMKRIDLNIKLDEKVMRQVEDGVEKDGKPKFKEVEVPAYDVAVQWISVMVERAINKPKVDIRSGRLVPTVEVSMPVQRTYGKMMDCLEAHKEGIAEMDDELFDFMDRKFHQAEISVQREVNRILIRLDDAINKANVEV